MRRLAPEDQTELRPRFNEIAKSAMAPQSALYGSALRPERPVLGHIPTKGIHRLGAVWFTSLRQGRWAWHASI